MQLELLAYYLPDRRSTASVGDRMLHNSTGEA